jgi:signal transduction histidine kinase
VPGRLKFLLPREFDSDPNVPLGPPVRDFHRLLLEERARADAYINLIRIGTATASLGVVPLVTPEGHPGLVTTRAILLGTFLLWGLAQLTSWQRRGAVKRWLMPTNAVIDVTVVSGLIAAWGLLGPVEAQQEFATPEFFGYFVVLAFRPITLSARATGTVSALAVLEYAVVLAVLMRAGRLAPATPHMAWFPFEVIKLIILTSAGAVFTAAAAWYEHVLRQALNKQAAIADQLQTTVRTLAANVETLSAAEQALRESEERYRAVNRTLEERVERRTEALRSANQELEAFSYSVSHDLRAPLRSIRGFAHIVAEEEGGRLSDAARRRLDLVEKNAAHMTDLIDALLQFGRMSRQPLRKVQIETDALVRGVIASLENETAGRAIEWTVRDLPPCQADHTLLTQVFANLISNAVKFTVGRDPARIEIGTKGTDHGPAYFVCDNGVGFDAAHGDRMFAVFQRLHSPDEFEGTGVGLALVRRIVERHGGRVWAEARPDDGACFYFTI